MLSRSLATGRREHSEKVMSTGLGNDMVMCQESTVAPCHYSFLHLENLASRLVGPVAGG